MALSALLGLIALAAPAGAETETRSYRCFDDSSFTLLLTTTEAVVRFKDGEYRLPRKPSSIAIKYADAKATLYLDHDFAAFVADDRPLPGCTRVRPESGPTKP
jgi:hypothetical protein